MPADLFKTEMDSAGLEAVQSAIETLEKMGGVVVGGVFEGRAREENPEVKNSEIIDWQAEGVVRKDGGIIKRNLLPSENEIDKAAELFAGEVESVLQRESKRHSGKKTKRKVKKKSKDKLANEAASKGFRKAGNYLKETMSERLEAGTNADGSAMQTVTEEYAIQREKEYGIGRNVIYKATGQVLSNLLDGTIKLVKK